MTLSLVLDLALQGAFARNLRQVRLLIGTRNSRESMLFYMSGPRIPSSRSRHLTIRLHFMGSRPNIPRMEGPR
jgi:hypothetical protein